MKTFKSVEIYIESKKEWTESLILLREIFEATKLQETIKWGIRNQEAGKILKPQAARHLEIPEELESTLKDNPALKERFQTLTLSKQREYCEYVSQAKREETRKTRLQKICPMILEGAGLNDKYKK